MARGGKALVPELLPGDACDCATRTPFRLSVSLISTGQGSDEHRAKGRAIPALEVAAVRDNDVSRNATGAAGEPVAGRFAAIERFNYARGYDSDNAIIDARPSESNVAIVDTSTVSGEGGMDSDGAALTIPSSDLDEETFDPVKVELKDHDGNAHEVTVIGVLDASLSIFIGIYTNQTTTDSIYGQLAATSYRIQLASSVQPEAVAKEMESALLPYGVQGMSLQAQLEELQRENNDFFLILQAFMALVMLVGLAAIGMIAFRNVIDRRQQIGVLRAIGFQRNQVSLSSLIESAFIVGLGVVLETVLGLTPGQLHLIE